MHKKTCVKPKFRADLFSEFIGSMFLVMAAVSPIILFNMVLKSSISVALLANAIAVAFILYALIEIFKNVSGAHFNPVVTVIMALEEKSGLRKVVSFVLAQIAGGISGVFLCNLMFRHEVGGFFFVSDVIRNEYIYFGEIIGTFILVFAILMLAQQKSSKLPIVVALLVGGQIMSTSSTMFANPQVTIARIFTNSAAGIRPIDCAVFIVMQFVGAFLAYLVYKVITKKRETANICDPAKEQIDFLHN